MEMPEVPAEARSARLVIGSASVREQENSYLEAPGDGARRRRRRGGPVPQASQKEVVQLFDGGGRTSITP